MEDFSKIYEKLIDMGFPTSEVDSVIAEGLYTFEDIFNELVERERSLTSTEWTIINNLEQAKLGTSNDHNDDGTIDNNDSTFKLKLFKGDHSVRVLATDNFSESKSFQPTKELISSKLEILKNYPQVQSSSSLSYVDASIKNTTKIQIMDLLDLSQEPKTYSQSFLAKVCSIRDLICWFCQLRQTAKACVNSKFASCQSRVSISIETEARVLISFFENLKWHFVLPSGANSQRIFGRENLDKCLCHLGLTPHAHLLAIVGCPPQLRHDNSLISSPSSSMSTNNHSILHCATPIINPTNHDCQVSIKMINYRNNPLYFQGRSSFRSAYNPNTTTLQKVVSDFENFCQLDLSSFSFLDRNSDNPFIYPDDYSHFLKELGIVGNVTLYCHLRMASNDNNSEISSTWRSQERSDSNNSHNNDLFPGTGQTLEGSRSFKTMRDIWSERIISNTMALTKDKNAIQSQEKSLFRQCLAVLYKAVKGYNFVVCREVRRLPNNIQQILIKRLIEEKSLTASVLSHFCTQKSALTTLDLSYTVQATNEVLRCVSRCSNIQEIILDNEDHIFTNEGLLHLRYCLNLRRLSLNYCSRINDSGIVMVVSLPKLSVLSIKKTAITDVGLRNIALKVTQQNSQTVAAYPSLTSLDLSGLTITDQSFEYLAFFSHLELLSLASTAITDPSRFPYLENLQHLNISNCAYLIWNREIHIRSLVESFPFLTSISLAGVSNLNLPSITKALSLCSNLHQIEGFFSHAQMTASLLSTLSHLPLDSIILSNCSHVDDLWLPVIARFSVTLSHLVLSYCPNVVGKNNSLLRNLGGLSHLSWLDLTHLENVDSQQISQIVLESHFPRMQVVWFSLTEEEESLFLSCTKHIPFKVNITTRLQQHIQ